MESRSEALEVHSAQSMSSRDARHIGAHRRALYNRILWYKDGKRIRPSSRTLIRQRRQVNHLPMSNTRGGAFELCYCDNTPKTLYFRLSKNDSIRSVLRVRNANVSDGGNFECRLRSIPVSNSSSRNKVNINFNVFQGHSPKKYNHHISHI